ncbi:MAG TPA: DUF6448 family protein [Thermomicrobiales bacterium]|nr:DUF6448 family protein [Thermomicrobiales bacterium]
MSRTSSSVAIAIERPSIGRKILLAAGAAALLLSIWLWNASPASAHCDSATGPVVTAAQQALDSGDVKIVLPYVKAEQEAELIAAFNQASTVRQAGGEAQALADRYFHETAVRLHRLGEGAAYTGIKEHAELDPALEAAEAALTGGSLDGVYQVLDASVREGVQEHYQAVLDAREREAKKPSVERTRVRVEAELEFENYVLGINNAIHGNAHSDTTATAGRSAHVEKH